MKRRHLLLCLVCLLSLGLAIPPLKATPQEPPETIHVDLRAKGEPFPHFWEQMFGSGRAILASRRGK